MFRSNGNRRLANFWVRFVIVKELDMLVEESSNSDAEAFRRDLDAASHVRLVASGELAAARVWTDDWQRIPPGPGHGKREVVRIRVEQD
jgi:hypothetical protein